ncbi:MAG: LysR family transcriptional regulator [Rhodobacter sp.]|nr:LysR family transcriptional regulator [Rhodobacter sp.]
MRINFDFADLEAFLAVKETGSFHLAAEKMRLSQSAVTRRVRKLEQALDTPLFERTTRAVKPTLAAKRLQARAEALLGDARETAQAMRDESVAFAHQRSAMVTVASVPTVVSRLLVPAMQRAGAAGRVSRLRLLDGSANEVAEAVAQGEADFGLCSIPMLEPATEFETLFDDRIVLAVPPGHALIGRDEIAWAELAGTPLIVPARGTGNRLLIDEAMAHARLPLHWTFEVGRSSTALDLVTRNMGVALVPLSAAQSVGVAVCFPTAPEIARPIGLLSRTGQPDAPAVAALKTAIRAVA